MSRYLVKASLKVHATESRLKACHSFGPLGLAIKTYYETAIICSEAPWGDGFWVFLIPLALKIPYPLNSSCKNYRFTYSMTCFIWSLHFFPPSYPVTFFFKYPVFRNPLTGSLLNFLKSPSSCLFVVCLATLRPQTSQLTWLFYPKTYEVDL